MPRVPTRPFWPCVVCLNSRSSRTDHLVADTSKVRATAGIYRRSLGVNFGSDPMATNDACSRALLDRLGDELASQEWS